jgi:ApaG protein
VNTAITNGIKVSVVSRYEAQHSDPKTRKFVHSYAITIENISPETVQLLSRHWIIVDSDLNTREIKGDGVVGKQPILHPGEAHQYASWCPLATDIGKMSGSYLMRSESGDHFNVVVPGFILCQKDRLN